MRVHNHQIAAFLKKVTLEAKKILQNELGVEVRKSRFLYNNYLYPISVVCFEDHKKLGEFDPSNYTISINRIFINSDKELLKRVIRHELAHYMAYLKFGIDALNHGDHFKSICIDAGWDQTISSPAMDISEIEQTDHSSKFHDKVKKLLNLADNSNEHESKIATAKANQLMLKHGITTLDNIDDDICVKEVLQFKRRNNKHIAIYDILSHFYVKPVFSKSNGYNTIEVTGSRDAVELAHYVADFLDYELEKLWEQTKQDNNLKGIRAKNSFFTGISKGYLDKIGDAREVILAEDPMALIKIEKDLTLKAKQIYKRLGSTQSQSQTDHNSFAKGFNAGKNLTIKKGIKGSLTGLLPWQN